MTKKLLIAAFIMLFLGIPAVNAQEHTNVYKVPKHAVSVQMPINPRKMGIGARFSYNFTSILRFTVDADWYCITFPKGRMKTITRDLTKTGTTPWGRQFDINANANLVFGDGNFNFYLIVGFYSSMGYSKTGKLVKDLYTSLVSNGSDDYYDTEDYDGNIYYDEEGNSYIYTDRVSKYYSQGIGINAGFGAELQTSERSRFFIEQQVSLGLMTAWMPKLGWSYCF